MLNLSATVAYGAPIVIANLDAWRLLGPGRSTTKAIGRCASFAALTYMLFATGVSPLAVPVSPERQAIQVIGIAWWLQCALVFSLMLDHLLLPRAWRTRLLFHDIAAGTVILGLAVQNTLNDVFSGLMPNTTQPFRLGDTVTIGDLGGRIVESNWRATKLINSLGNLVVVPKRR
ncbi:mechanosensitive ion channel domain-containing protein [Burkholderia sp. AW33-5]